MGRRLSAFLAFLVSSVMIGPVAAQAPSTSGTVLAQGKPVEGAKVWLHYFRAGAQVGELIETQTDAKGKFRLSGPREETIGFGQLIARAPDGRLGWHDLYLNGTPNTDIRIELLRVGEARGRLADAQGRGVTGARVQLQAFYVGSGTDFYNRERRLWLPEALRKQFEAGLNVDGSFAIGGVPLGANAPAVVSGLEYGQLNIGFVQGSPAVFRFERPGQLRIHFAGADDIKKLAGLRLNLFVSGQSFTPESPQLMFFSKELTLTGTATLEVAKVLPGEGELRFQGAQEVPYIPATLPKLAVKSGEVSAVTVALMPAARVRGRIVDRKTGKGIAAAMVSISCQDRQGKNHPAFATSGKDGTFTAYVRPGHISARLNSPPPGYVDIIGTSRAEKPVDVAARREHTFPHIVLEEAVPVEGIVVDDAGKPVPGMAVHSASGPNFTTTDAKGRFLLKTLAAGEVTALRARTQRAVTDGAVPLDTVEQKGPVKLVLSEKWASGLKGRVVDGTGKPLAGATVHVMWNYRGAGRSGPYGYVSVLETLHTDEAGRFKTTALWPGDQYHVEVTAEGFAKAHSAIVRGKAGQVYDAGAIALVPSGGFVRGVVVDSSGKPLAGVPVFNQGDAPRPLATTTGGDGRFQLTGLFDGRCYVFARKTGYRFTMLQVDTGMPEARITLLRSNEPPPALEQPVYTKEHVAALQKLTNHLIDKGLTIPEASGYRSLIFECCLVQTDLPRAKKWLTANPPAEGAKSRYVRALRLAEAEHVAGTDVDEALTLLAPVDDYYAFLALLKLGGRFAGTDPERSLRFAEEAVVRARAMHLPQRAEALAKAGELVRRLGQKAAGKKLLAEAVALAEKFGSDGLPAHYRAEVASYLAVEDLPGARALLKPLLATESAKRWLCRVAERLASTNVKAALAMLAEANTGRSLLQPQTQLRIVLRVAKRDPGEAVRIAESIADAHYQAEALVHVAAIVARHDRKLAWSLIDRSFAICLDRRDGFRSYSNIGGRGLLAAWIAGQAQQVGYPDMASVVARVLACRDTDLDEFSPIHRLENQVRMAKILAVIDPPLARNMLGKVAQRRELLRTGDSDFRIEEWLLARSLADPARAPGWVDEAIAKLNRKDNMASFGSAIIQLAQVLTAPPERRLRALMGLNSLLTFPDEE